MNFPPKPLKRYGQNFLADKNVIKKIIDAIPLSKKDCVLEIGPGRGALTFGLYPRAGYCVAVEIDKKLSEFLREKLKGEDNVEIITDDILRFNLKKYAKISTLKSFKLVGNLPYYITSPILEYIFKNIKLLDDIFITVQKEVAERMTAAVGSKEYSSLTCLVNYYCSPKILFKIKKGSFRPVPDVDSCFMRLSLKTPQERGFKVNSEELFFKIVRSAFGQRRKKLYTSISRVLAKKDLQGLAPQDLLNRRAEELALKDFAYLSDLIFEAVKKMTPRP